MKVRLRFLHSVLRPGANNSHLSHSLRLDDGTVAHLGYIQPKQVWLTSTAGNYNICSFSDMKLSR